MSQREWSCHIEHDWMTGHAVVFLLRRYNEDQSEVIIGFDDNGYAICQTFPRGTMPDFRGLRLPEDAVQAIAEHVKPGPSKAELARLEDALRLERERVDRVLANFTPGAL